MMTEHSTLLALLPCNRISQSETINNFFISNLVFCYSTNGQRLTPSRFGVTTGDKWVLTQWGLTSRFELLTVGHVTMGGSRGSRGQDQSHKGKVNGSIFSSPPLTWSPTEEPYAVEILESTSLFQSPAVLWHPPQLHRWGDRLRGDLLLNQWSEPVIHYIILSLEKNTFPQVYL